MTTSTVSGGVGKMASRLTSLLVLAFAVGMASAQSATISTVTSLPDYEMEDGLLLTVSATDNDVIVFQQFDVVPLTPGSGLNQSQVARNTIDVHGNIEVADVTNYISITDDQTVAYLSCDQINSSFITTNQMFATLMNNKPKAILLYSLVGPGCGITGSPTYQSIFSMTRIVDASQMLNTTVGSLGPVVATFTSNGTGGNNNDDSSSQVNSSNSAVAMSILYSITGLITLLFLIIIATGAIRAHRYPERYGPRAGHGGRPRQSRAKGLARAVLETLPIVKFGDPEPPKPDPELELESASVQHRPGTDEPAATPAIPRQQGEQQLATGDERTAEEEPGAGPGSNGKSVAMAIQPGAASVSAGDDDNLGCSICTEDFTVGEDVRVLPCNHKFHPPCIDPWLMNVSGTCPLCRLDLRPKREEAETPTAAEATAAVGEDSQQLAPPLEAENVADGPADASASTAIAAISAQRRRGSRLFDLNRLRHASVEERIEALRRYRSQQQAESTAAAGATGGLEGESEERGRRARLTARLREKFRVRTTAQSLDAGGPSSAAEGVTPEASAS